MSRAEMTNHPGRPPAAPLGLTPATPADLRALIEQAGISQADAARRCHASLRTMQQWLAGDRAMPLAASELLALSLYWPEDGHLDPQDYRALRRWVRGEFMSLLMCAPPADRPEPIGGPEARRKAASAVT